MIDGFDYDRFDVTNPIAANWSLTLSYDQISTISPPPGISSLSIKNEKSHKSYKIFIDAVTFISSSMTKQRKR